MFKPTTPRILILVSLLVGLNACGSSGGGGGSASVKATWAKLDTTPDDQPTAFGQGVAYDEARGRVEELARRGRWPCYFFASDTTGEKALEGFDWKKPKPLASSPGIRFLSDTSLTSMTRRI